MDYYLQTLACADAEPGVGRVLKVTFADGYTAVLDLSPWIARGGIRAALEDPSVFGAVLVNEFGVPEWPGEIDLSPGALRAWCEAGRVLTKDETDAWIIQHTRSPQEVA